MPELTRRAAITAGMSGAAIAWLPIGRVPALAGEVPPGFPESTPLYRSVFANWSGETRVEDLWTCAPRTAAEVVDLSNWAAGAGWRLRPRGQMHTWSPLVVGPDDDPSTLVLMDLSALDSVELVSPGPTHGRVRAGTGISMDRLQTAMLDWGLGLPSVPTIGTITLGGVLAVGAHGATVHPGAGRTALPGQSFGSVANLVTELTAVVWNPKSRTYQLRTFDRHDPELAALLVNLGRTVVTSVVLRAPAAQRLRCVSHTGIPGTELFAPPAKAGTRSFSALLASHGTVDALWFVFTKKPWVKTWTPSPTRPLLSRQTGSPYNYPFTDRIPPAVSALAADMLAGNAAATPLFGELMYDVVVAGLTATLSTDLWGWSKDVNVWNYPTSMPSSDLGFTVLCARDEVQDVVARFAALHQGMLASYRTRGLFPHNLALHVRATALDRPLDVDGAVEPALSAACPDGAHPEWDTAVWINLLYFAGPAGQEEFFTEIQDRVFAEFDGGGTRVRVEWAKNWAIGPGGSWTHRAVIERVVPASLPRWNSAVTTLDSLDPYRVFSNAFLDRLLVPR
ncbi:MAG TPA: cholesterol oxidase substrate-binding domain-containing protein [Nocardioidaceae bacterium]|nr:cholesterol oxidase substrate-binding domain-containing protein [Nocardioidaceae bacterium]